MSWLDKILTPLVSRRRSQRVPDGLWNRCEGCDATLYQPDLEKNLHVCPKCGFHARIGARQRLEIFLDSSERRELAADVEPVDQLRFQDVKKYKERLSSAQKATGEKDALVAEEGTLHGMPVVVAAFEFAFHGGSMGYAVGEKFSRAADTALQGKIPLVCFSASGGARMQEALISLMQMAKTSAVLEKMKEESVPYISVLTDPVYGGVSASLASLGDVIIAEPEARAGFAGPNIIRDTMRIPELPEGFQRSEFLLEHGAIDMIMPRHELRPGIASLLAKMTGQPAPNTQQGS